MNLYTIVFLSRGGSYISQFSAANEREALDMWLNNPHREMLVGIGFAKKKATWISTVRPKLEDEDSRLVPLSGLQSAWYTYISLGRSGGHINVFKTRREGHRNRRGSGTVVPKVWTAKKQAR